MQCGPATVCWDGVYGDILRLIINHRFPDSSSSTKHHSYEQQHLSDGADAFISLLIHSNRTLSVKPLRVSVSLWVLVPIVQHIVCSYKDRCWAFTCISVAPGQWAAGSLKSCVADEADVGTKQMGGPAPLLAPAEFERFAIKSVTRRSVRTKHFDWTRDIPWVPVEYKNCELNFLHHLSTPNLVLRRNPTGLCSGGGGGGVIHDAMLSSRIGRIDKTNTRMMNRMANLDPFNQKRDLFLQHCSFHILDYAPGASPVLLCSRADRTHVLLLTTDATTDHGTKKAEWSCFAPANKSTTLSHIKLH